MATLQLELRSVLVVPVAGVPAAVDEWRERTCNAKPSGGIPAHITVLFPFVPAAELDAARIAEVEALFGDVRGFDFQLRELRAFPRILYLAPEPDAPFALLTRTMIERYPEYPPYGGAHGEVVPHLTVAEGDQRTLEIARTAIAPSLPVSARCEELLLLAEAARGRWTERARIALASAQ